MKAKQSVGIDLEWDYEARKIVCSMDECIETALREFKHDTPKQHFFAPSKVKCPDYGAKVQYVHVDTTKKLNAEQVQPYVQKVVVGKFLFMTRAIDNTLLHALNDIACAVTKGMEATLKATEHVLNYIASNPRTPRYQASNMILQVDSDATYLVCSEACSQAGGFHYLSLADISRFNAPIHVLAKVIKDVMYRAAEAKVAALFMNAQEVVSIRTCLEEMGHAQPPIPLKTNNSTATGILPGTIKQNHSNAIDMWFYWL